MTKLATGASAKKAVTETCTPLGHNFLVHHTSPFVTWATMEVGDIAVMSHCCARRPTTRIPQPQKTTFVQQIIPSAMALIQRMTSRENAKNNQCSARPLLIVLQAHSGAIRLFARMSESHVLQVLVALQAKAFATKVGVTKTLNVKGAQMI